MQWKRIAREVALLVGISFVAAGAHNALAPKNRSLSWIGSYTSGGETGRIKTPADSTGPGARSQSQTLAGIAPPKDPSLLYLDITGDVVERLHAAGALFLDARRTDVYQKGHIAGARSISVWERDADEKIAALQTQGIPYEQVIVVYCSGGNCPDSKALSEKLAMAGFYNIYIYKDGFPDWTKRGLAVREGSTP